MVVHSGKNRTSYSMAKWKAYLQDNCYKIHVVTINEL
jgi:hypothetical protein